MRNKIIFVLFLLISATAANVAAAEIPPFNKNDRVLILAAHPDDETIGAAGAIQKAIKAGAAVKVVLYTNGDNNEPAFIIYEKRLTFRRGEFLHMGEVRRKETISALVSLGLSGRDIIFLGYPDFGTMEILLKYWGNVKPYKGFFTRNSKVPYPECMSPGAPYVGESIMKDLKKILIDFRPTKVFVTHPADRNGDHRSLYLFLRVALWDLEGKLNAPEIYPDIIHLTSWPQPRGYHPELGLLPPGSVAGISWLTLPLTEKEVERKNAAISYYKSEIEYDPPYLFTFARSDELYGDFPVIKLTPASKTGAMEWSAADPSGSLAYACADSYLYIRLNLKRKADKGIGMSVFLFGYSRKIDFAVMPKIRISVDAFGIHAKNRNSNITIKDAEVSYEENSVTLKVPLKTLGSPDYLLASVRAINFSDGQKGWRILNLISK